MIPPLRLWSRNILHHTQTLPSIPVFLDEPTNISVSETEIIHTIRSFPNSSAAGPDGLKPRHLKDAMTMSSITSGGAQALLNAMASFIKLVLEDKTLLSVRTFFFGASLTALCKKGGGIRSIAVGCTYVSLLLRLLSIR